MTTRRRKATSNRKTKHRPQIGFKVDTATGLPSRTQPRFNFGDDPQEFEYRLALVKRLYHEDCKANEGSECWSPLALSYARQIERGVYEIPFEVPQELIEDGLTADQLAIEYVFMLRVQQKNYPSLKLVPADEELFHRGIVGNRAVEAQRVSSLYSDLVNEGTIESVPTLNGRLIGGTLHEAFDAYV